ncbi:MAG: hypothetical protein GEV04_22465 [Actinophytocola sp.]|nr:hypothetical protein [Actinophytocola sp.]
MTWARHSGPDEEQGWSAEVRAAERERREEQAGKAAITVAGHSANADECKELLDMLGLEPALARR